MALPIYQLAKLRMLEFYDDFMDKYLNRRDFELIQMDSGSLYMALLSNSIDELVKPELREEYNNSRKVDFLLIWKYHGRTPGLFKAEFHNNRNCYYQQMLLCRR